MTYRSNLATRSRPLCPVERLTTRLPQDLAKCAKVGGISEPAGGGTEDGAGIAGAGVGRSSTEENSSAVSRARLASPSASESSGTFARVVVEATTWSIKTCHAKSISLAFTIASQIAIHPPRVG